MTYDLKCTGNISKKLLLMSAGVSRNFKKITVEQYIDYSACENCPNFKIYRTNPLDKNYQAIINNCRKSCPSIVRDRELVEYVNESNRLKLNKEDETRILSKIQLKLLILLHFMPEIDSSGLIKDLSIIRLSKTIACETKTIRASLEALEDKGYIIYSRAGSLDIINVIILGYEDQRLTKAQGGTGYIKVAHTVVEKILEYDNINYIRILIRMLLEEDKNNPNRDSLYKKSAFYSYDEIKKFLPAYMNSRQAIVDILKGMADIFDITFYEEKIIFSSKGQIDFIEVKDRLENQALSTFFGYNQVLAKKDIEDLSQLSLKYGLRATHQAFKEVLLVYKNRLEEKVNNLAGLVTQIIRTNNILALA